LIRSQCVQETGYISHAGDFFMLLQLIDHIDKDAAKHLGIAAAFQLSHAAAEEGHEGLFGAALVVFHSLGLGGDNGLNHFFDLSGIEINRKMLSEMAIHDPAAFTQLAETAKKALEK